MRNAVAEWMLSVVVPRDRAASILGDLLEAEVGTLAFWSALLRSAVSIAAHRPYRFLFNLFGFAIEFGSYALWIWVFTHVIGVSLLVAILVLIPSLLPRFWGIWMQRRKPPTAPRMS